MVMKRALILLGILAAGGLAYLSAQTDISGVWLLRTSNNDGTYRKTFFKLNQQGNALTGSADFNYRNIDISNGSVDNGKFHFAIGNGRRQRTVEGSLAGDRLQLEMKSADGKVIEQGDAQRSSEQAMAPPAPRPLPELHDVPDNGLARTPPMGWNSWNHFSHRIDDKTVREIADAMASNGMKDAGYIYVNIDDTWQGERDASGKIHANSKFPDMKALADYVHSKGLKIGIYSSPGPTTCAAYAGSFGHETDDAQTYAEWGFDYLKYDWCSASAIYKDKDMQQLYQVMGNALQATHRPIVYSLCQYGREDVWDWGAKVGGNSWRTTGDISDNWNSMAKIGFSQLRIAPYATIGHWNDPDMLEIGNGGMSDDEYKTHMTMWSMLRSPLLAGNDVRNMSADTKSILLNKEVIAIDQDRAGKPAKLAKTEGETEIWTRPLAGGATALAFFNRGDQPAKVTLQWSDAGLKTPKRARDLWAHKDVKVSKTGYTAEVPVHGTVVLRLK